MSDSNPTLRDDDPISLRPLFEAVWVHRALIIRLWAVAAVVFAVGALTYYLVRPTERVARVEFRLLFEGADKDQYPNETPFSRADLIAGPVITRVYELNDLKRYLPFEAFKNGLFVFESSREVELLNFEYQGKLSNTRLDAVGRAALEGEYREKLAALRVPQFSLQFSQSGRTDLPPTAVMQKVLNDILAEWAEQAAAQRGALGYQIELITPNVILKDTLDSPTMLIRYDLLRRHVTRVREQLLRLGELPGANSTRVGADKLSLLDLRTTLEDMLEFHLNPLIRRRLIYSLSRDEVTLNILYLDDRILELQRTRETARQRKGQLEQALQAFTSDISGISPGAGRLSERAQSGAVTPTVNDSFLDRLMDISARSAAMEYRSKLTDDIIAAGEQSLAVEQDIEFYQETQRLLRAAITGPRPSALQPENVIEAFQEIQARVVDVLKLSNDAYATVSAQNLNPRTVLYALTGPYTTWTVRTVSLRYLAMAGAVFLMVAGMLIALGVAGLALFRQSSFAQKKGHA